MKVCIVFLTFFFVTAFKEFQDQDPVGTVIRNQIEGDVIDLHIEQFGNFLQLEDDETFEKVNSEDLQLDSQFYEEQSELDADEIFTDDSEDKTDNYDGNLWEV
jgi:hypothetical protein